MERERFDEIGKKIKREAEIVASIEQTTTRHMSSAGTLNIITPCAACKLLRRRCAQECPFSPYFPPHEPHKFASVHKVFGASNVSKLLMEVPESQRADAANSLVYEATLRLQDPVYGCMSTISALQQQVQLLEAELQAVRTEIMKHKYKQTSQVTNQQVRTTSALISLPADMSMAVPIEPVTAAPAAPVASSSSLYNATPNPTDTDYNSISNSENMTFFGRGTSY
ncbi:LOB domain-containing protein 15-like isoform X1 [Carex rostrata]